MRKLPIFKRAVLVMTLAVALAACGTAPTGNEDPPPPPPERLAACTDLDATIVIPDPVFRSYLHVRTGIPEGQPLTCGALRALTQLSLGSTRTVSSLEGAEHLQNVTSISLDEQDLLVDAEFDRLGALPNVTRLSINGAAQLKSIKFAASFTGLDFLRVDYTALTSLEGVEGLTVLRTAYVRDNPGLTSAAQLGGLENLETVHLTGNAITSLAPFTGLAKLRILLASGNALTAVGVRDTPALEQLQLTDNQLSSLPAFAGLGMPNLTSLAVAVNQLTDLAGLEGLTLTFLAASGNKLTTIHHIADLKGVRTLYLNGNLLTDMTPLRTIEWGSGATVELGQNCLGVIYYPESGLHTLPAGPNNEAWKDLTMSQGVTVHLMPLATDNRCDGKPGY